MSEQQAELVSALLDGELDGEQREQALAAVLADPALAQRWQAYHLIGDAMRAQHGGGDEIAARVRAALDKEPDLPHVLPAGSARAPRRSWLQPLGGLALAASLATVAVLGGRSFEGLEITDTVAQAPVLATGTPAPGSVQGAAPADGEKAPKPAQDTPAPTLQVADAATSRMQWTTSQPAVQQRLNAYLVDYSEYLGTDLRGMLPYARVVGYDGRQP